MRKQRSSSATLSMAPAKFRFFFGPQAENKSDLVFPAACTSGKTLCAKRVYFCVLEAHKSARFGANPPRRQSHFDFVDEYKQNGAAKLLRFAYMVEDKMKKMKNCYLRVLYYPTVVS